jgi:hydroxymethylpyrimidine pyrophosphatase-like HAD family hydrolase
MDQQQNSVAGKPGAILLDLDGTILSPEMKDLEKVQQILKELERRGWILIFATGRTYRYALSQIVPLHPTGWIACYNGALLVQPIGQSGGASIGGTVGKYQTLYRAFFPIQEHFNALQKIMHSYPLLLCHPREPGDDGAHDCYYMGQVDEQLRHYYSWRQQKTGESWLCMEGLNQLPINCSPSLKYFGYREVAQEIAEQLGKIGPFQGSIIEDTYEGYVILQYSIGSCNKALVVDYLRNIAGIDENFKVIAAGNDYNDLEMLMAADLAITVQGAPEQLIRCAEHIVAPPAEYGVLEALLKLTC